MIILTREGISTTALSICKMSVHYCDHRMVLYPAFLFLRIHCKEAYFSIFFEICSLRMQEIYCNQRDENRATVAKSVSSSCFLQKHRGLSVALCSAETSHSASSCAKKIHCICSNKKNPFTSPTHKHTIIIILMVDAFLQSISYPDKVDFEYWSKISEYM